MNEQHPEPDAAEPAARTVEPPPTTTTIQAIERRRWGRGLFALVASVVVLLTLGFGAARVGDLLHRTPEQIALTEVKGASDARSVTNDVAGGGTATVDWSESLGEAVLTANRLPAIGHDEVFEAWLTREGETAAAALFDAADAGQTIVVLDRAVQIGDTVTVTVEQVGGAPDGVPTTDPIVELPTG